MARVAVRSINLWGRNTDGQCNILDSVTNPVCIAAGGFHSLALNADGTVAAWGKNWDGQTNVPTAATNVVAIAAGGSHSLALKEDGSGSGLGPQLGWANQCARGGDQRGRHCGRLGSQPGSEGGRNRRGLGQR